MDQADIMKVEEPEEFARRVGIQFNNHLLLARALTHRSYLNEHNEALEDNERLEFLGDAVLDFIVGAWLYHAFPEMPEGDLTRMRSALVHTEQLANFGRKLNIGSALRLGKGEAAGGGRQRDVLLCDTFEALIGAIYIEKGIEAVNAFIFPFLLAAVEDIIDHHRLEDPKSRFQEWAQAQGYATPQYQTKNSGGPDHSKVFEVAVMIDQVEWGVGSGHSKQAAAKAAAQDALRRLGLVD
jgi:ribonuclease-3